MEGVDAPGKGTVTCAAWIRRPENAHLVVVGKSKPSSLEIFSWNPITTSLSSSPKAKYEFGEGDDPVIIAVHPSGDELVCSTSAGDCKLFELDVKEDKIKLTSKEQLLLQGIGPQKCLAFSVDGTRFSTGGVDGCLRLFEWPKMRAIVEEPRAHKSFQDMDFSLDSEFLATTSADGSAIIWNTSDGTPVTTLTRNSDEKIELCRFSKDGTKPFLFCSVQRGNKPLTVVYDISTWKKVGHKRLLRKPATIMSISLDGKYLSLVILTTSKEWGVMATKLAVPADWKDWQIYMLLLGLFLASLIAFYIIFENSDSFWNFPVAQDQAARPVIESVVGSDPFGENLDLDYMNYLQHLPRNSALPLQSLSGYSGKPSCVATSLAMVKGTGLTRRSIVFAEAASGSVPSTADETSKINDKSETYSHDMTAAMGAVLTYRHELGMNYNFIRPDLIVGSCLQTPADVDKLRAIGVKTIFCLQENSDLEYFGVDITAIREYANSFDDIQHVRAKIRWVTIWDFDAFDLRFRLPAVVSKLHKAVTRNGGVAYIHCTAGLGRAPATASKRSCFPKLEAIKSATADIESFEGSVKENSKTALHLGLLRVSRLCLSITFRSKLTGTTRKPVKLKWHGTGCSTVEISGLDIGWGQRMPLSYSEEDGLWILHRDLPEGRYEYKYIVDGEWMCNEHELITSPNQDGHVNNYIEVFDDTPDSNAHEIRSRLTSDEPDLSSEERAKIRQFLESFADEVHED
ncbi:hypothetical protein SASPL_151259 [Salvia splendens]|uniref:AMP-activated protein kinase glycogen-binding domain-containing protein n=1 Tax=Salvia splendens TaxID=180675 RepID=A0A8X8W820_SALSN|nr:hypothetical protein SASPL_151259 [Salvia splendens]